MNGCDRPTLRDLFKQVVPLVHSHWYKLGIELLDPKYASALDIGADTGNTGNDTTTCCRKMFKRWLETDELASWDKLIDALTILEMNSAASDIKQRLLLPLVITRKAGDAIVIDQIENKDDIPTMRDLNRYVIKNYAVDWKDIGIELGLNFDVIDFIEKDHPHQAVACLQEVLSKWLKTTPNATWKTLEVALTNVRRQPTDIDPVHDRPTLRDLVNHVVPSVADHWYDLGLQLLDPKYENVLDTIEADTKNDTKTCCRKMFSKWLNTDELASWDKLIEALTLIGLTSSVGNIRQILLAPAATTADDGAVVINQIQNKDDIPTMRDLNRYVIKNYAADWKDIGIELGLNVDMIDFIEKDHPHQVVACFRQSLHKWLKFTPNATWKTLEVALTNVRRQQLGLDPIDDVHASAATATVDGAVVIDQIQNKDDTPTMRDLNRYVVRNYAADWRDIGIELGLDPGILEMVERDYPDQIVARFQMSLYKWLNATPNATWKTLEVALTNVRRQQIGLNPVDDVHDVIAVHLKKRYYIVISQNSKDTWSPFMAEPCPIAALVKTVKTASYTKQNMKSLKISNIEQFFSEFGINLTGVILIEGGPGMGKTTLTKTISAKWAIGKLLTFSRLLFLLFLRDPNVQRITTLQELTKYFTQEASKAEQLCSYLESVNGEDIVFILDGLDEVNIKLFQSTYFQKLISRQHLTKATIIVTSRPSAAALLYDFVDWKINILGFDESSREQYATEALKNSPQLLLKLQRHFQEHSYINALCYTPSVMSIITFLCLHHQEDLPLTVSEMYKRFIMLIILRSLNMAQTDILIKSINDLPSPVGKAYQHLGKFAYESLVKDKIVFSVEELPELCRYDPTYYGLLQTVEHYSAATATRSFNFIHFTLQEYLAANYVAILPPGEVDDLLMESFLINSSKNSSSVHLYNMWIFFCGITGGQCIFQKHYLTPDPIKILYLYECCLEAQDDKMCGLLSTSFDKNTINLKDYQFVHLYWITSLGLILSESSHKKWKEINLFNCHIGDYGIHLLCQYFCRGDKEREVTTIDLRENSLTEVTLPHICTIIRYFQPHTLKLGCNYIASMQGISDAVKILSSVKVLNLWGIGVTERGGAAIADMLVVLVELNVSNNYLADHGAVLISEGIASTKTLQKLYINDNEIGPLGTKAIADALSVNTSLELLNMSKNAVGQDGASAIAKAITTNKTLTKLYFWDDRTLDEESAMLIVRSLHLNDVIVKCGLPKRLASDNRLVNYLDNINVARNKSNVQELVLAFY